MQCPECASYTVQRLYLATIHCDSCSCDACGARWDEDRATGAIRPCGTRSSALVRE
jgi:ribosomal protein L37AE/L43A